MFLIDLFLSGLGCIAKELFALFVLWCVAAPIVLLLAARPDNRILPNGKIKTD